MNNMVDLLKQVKEVDPPADLVGNVLSRISQDRYRRQPVSQSGFLSRLGTQQKPFRKFAFAFASIFIIGLAGVMILLHLDPLSHMDISGSIGLNSVLYTQNYLIQGEQIAGDVKIEQYSGHFFCTMKIRSDHAFNILLKFENGSAELSDRKIISGQKIIVDKIPDGYRISGRNDFTLRLQFSAEELTGQKMIITFLSESAPAIQQKIVFK